MTIRPVRRAITLAAVLAAIWPAQACSPQSTASPPTSTDTVGQQPKTTAGAPDCGSPTLRVHSPRDGATVTAPFPVTYETQCFSVEHDGTIYFVTDGIQVNLHPRMSTGTVTVPDHPLLSGRRTVTIQLTNPNGQPLKNSEATTMMTIVIEGSRGALTPRSLPSSVSPTPERA
jgi:hypothetical protein